MPPPPALFPPLLRCNWALPCSLPSPSRSNWAPCMISWPSGFPRPTLSCFPSSTASHPWPFPPLLPPLQQLAPVYEKLAKRFSKVDSVVIAKMDGTENEHPDVSAQVRGSLICVLGVKVWGGVVISKMGRCLLVVPAAWGVGGGWGGIWGLGTCDGAESEHPDVCTQVGGGLLSVCLVGLF